MPDLTCTILIWECLYQQESTIAYKATYIELRHWCIVSSGEVCLPLEENCLLIIWGNLIQGYIVAERTSCHITQSNEYVLCQSCQHIIHTTPVNICSRFTYSIMGFLFQGRASYNCAYPV